MDFISDMYVRMRNDDIRNTGGGAGKEDHSDHTKMYTTPRTLLGILRFSQALAKIRFADRVNKEDVTEAQRLMEASKISLVDENPDRTRKDPVTIVYDIIRNHSQSINNKVVKLSDVQNLIVSRGATPQAVQKCLEEYESLNVWNVNNAKTVVTFM
jgi:DNA replication licensing factor MCM7